jgi:DNA-binding phage protein
MEVGDQSSMEAVDLLLEAANHAKYVAERLEEVSGHLVEEALQLVARARN